MSREKAKQQIEQDYRRFIPAENDMQQTQQQTGSNFSVADTISSSDQASSPIVLKQEEPETEFIDTSTGAICKIKKHLTKKPLSPLDRKKNEKERKARHMRRLRKWLMPKNAIVALHELQGPGMTEFIINSVGTLTKAEIIINNVKYEAMGSSKNQAKAKACEKALRDLAISQMTRVKLQQEAKAAMNMSRTTRPTAPPPPSMNKMELDGDAPSEMDADDDFESDDLPMEHLASFALHKLFTEWESEGFEIPTLKPAKSRGGTSPVESGLTASLPSLPKVTKTAADLPPDAATRHPTALFAYMRPQVPYQDLGSNDDPLNREFTASINVDGKQFVGRGRSKKLARKAAAIDACKTLFDVEFDSSVLQG